MDHRLAALGQPLVVAGQPPAPDQPGERPLDDPATVQQDEPLLTRRLPDQFEHEPAELLRPSDGRFVGPVGPDQLQPRELRLEPLGDPLDPVAILDRGRVHDHRQEQAHGVDDEVPLPARDPLARVVTPVVAPLGGVHGLAVDDRCRRALLPAVGVPQPGPEHVEDLPPGAVESPPSVVIVDRAPGGQVVRQHPPGDTAFDDVEDAVENFAEVDRAGPPAGLSLGQEWLDQLPLGVSQVGWVRFACHGLPKPAKSTPKSDFSHSFLVLL